MTQIRIPVAADLLGVSDDTVRRWVDAGRLAGGVDDAGRKSVDGAELAALAQELADGDRMGEGARSARNHLTGLVTRVVSDTVMFFGLAGGQVFTQSVAAGGPGRRRSHLRLGQ